jgi:hypothetical protein
MAWALANDGHKPAKVLGAMAVAQNGQVNAVTHDLLQMGPKGRDAAVLFQSLLDYAGHRADAEAVGHLLV